MTRLRADRPWTRTYRMIDHNEADAYRAAGWTVEPFKDLYHAHWSMIAWRYA